MAIGDVNLHAFDGRIRDVILALDERFAIASALRCGASVAGRPTATSLAPFNVFGAPTLAVLDAIRDGVRELARYYVDIDPSGMANTGALMHKWLSLDQAYSSNYYLRGPIPFAFARQLSVDSDYAGGIALTPPSGCAGESEDALGNLEAFLDSAEAWIRRFRYLNAAGVSLWTTRIEAAFNNSTGQIDETVTRPSGGYPGSYEAGPWADITEADSLLPSSAFYSAVSGGVSSLMTGTYYSGLVVANPTPLDAACYIVPSFSIASHVNQGSVPHRGIHTGYLSGGSISDNTWNWFGGAFYQTESVDYAVGTRVQTFYSPDGAQSFSRPEAIPAETGEGAVETVYFEELFDPFGRNLSIGIPASVGTIIARKSVSVDALPAVTAFPTASRWSSRPAATIYHLHASFAVTPILDFGPRFTRMRPVA